MITLKELALAINRQLKTAFQTVPINSKDIKEGFARPSFTVDFDSSMMLKTAVRMSERKINIIIYYFPTDRNKYKLEMLDIQQRLEDTFCDELVIDDRLSLFLRELSSEIVDGVLQFAFVIDYVEVGNSDTEDAALDYMQDLHYKG